MHSLKEVLVDIKVEVIDKTSYQKSQELKPNITEAVKTDLLFKLREAVESKRPKACAPVIHEINSYALNKSDEVAFKQIQMLVEQYQFKEATVMLSAMN